mgnify:FL=1
MNILTGFAIYFIIWWISLFVVLPWGNRPDQNITKGNEVSAPAKPRLLIKFFITTILSIFIWLTLWAIIYFKIFTIVN